MWQLDYKERCTLKNWCFWTVMLEKTLESPLDCREIEPVHPKGNQSWICPGRDWCWSWNSDILTTWCVELTHLKWPWCWERLKAEREGNNRGWEGWMASPTRRTCVWVSSGCRWRTEKPIMLQSMGSQIVRHNWAPELNWTELVGFWQIKIYQTKHKQMDDFWFWFWFWLPINIYHCIVIQ